MLKSDEYITEIEQWGYFNTKLDKPVKKTWEEKKSKLKLAWVIFRTNKKNKYEFTSYEGNKMSQAKLKFHDIVRPKQKE